MKKKALKEEQKPEIVTISDNSSYFRSAIGVNADLEVKVRSDEEIIIGGCVFKPVTEKIYGKDIDDKEIILNQRKVKSKMLEGILKELLAEENEVLMSPIRFNGVSTIHIKQIFEKYGIVNESKF